MAAPRTVTPEEYFETVKESVSPEFLKTALERTPQGPTAQQLAKYDIDVCVVTYLDNDVMCANPVSWASTEYYISKTFQEGDIKYKIFAGQSD